MKKTCETGAYDKKGGKGKPAFKKGGMVSKGSKKGC